MLKEDYVRVAGEYCSLFAVLSFIAILHCFIISGPPIFLLAEVRYGTWPSPGSVSGFYGPGMVLAWLGAFCYITGSVLGHRERWRRYQKSPQLVDIFACYATLMYPVMAAWDVSRLLARPNPITEDTDARLSAALSVCGYTILAIGCVKVWCSTERMRVLWWHYLGPFCAVPLCVNARRWSQPLGAHTYQSIAPISLMITLTIMADIRAGLIYGSAGHILAWLIPLVTSVRNEAHEDYCARWAWPRSSVSLFAPTQLAVLGAVMYVLLSQHVQFSGLWRWCCKIIDVEHPLLQVSTANYIRCLSLLVPQCFQLGLIYQFGPGWIYWIVDSTGSPPRLLDRGVHGFCWMMVAVNIQALFFAALVLPKRCLLSDMQLQTSERRPILRNRALKCTNLVVCLLAFLIGRSALADTSRPRALGMILLILVFNPGLRIVSPLASIATSRMNNAVKEHRQLQRKMRRENAERVIDCRPRSATRYTYAPLSDPRDVRLLKLVASGDGIVTCDIIRFTLDNAPPFQAVSYCWGAPIRDHTLSIGSLGEQAYLPATQSVCNVFQTLFPISGECYLWIDYLCINQEDEREKVRQISLMRDIFTRADRVIGCLYGEADVELANELLQQLGLLRLPVALVVEAGYSSIAVGEPKSWAALRTLTTNPFFWRQWILQECVLAKKVDLIYEDIPVSWSLLTMLHKLPVPLYHKLTSFSEVDTLRDLVKVSMLRTLIDAKFPLPLTKLLAHARTYGVTEPHDNIYSLLGVCQREDALAFPVDYGKDIRTIYAEVARLAVRSNDSVFFGLIGHNDPLIKRRTGLPSWVADLGSLARVRFDSLAMHNENRGYHAGGPSRLHMGTNPDPGLLSLRGVLYDRIKVCGAEHDESLYSRLRFAARTSGILGLIPIYAEMLALVAEVESLVEEHLGETFPNTKARDEAIWRTLIEDFDGKAHPAKLETKREFDFLRSCLQRTAQEWMDQTWQDPAIPMMNFQRAPAHQESTSWFNNNLIVTTPGNETRFWDMMRKFAITEKGHMAIVPNGTNPGDIVAIIDGTPAPFILQPSGKGDGSYLFYGEAFVLDMMDGRRTMHLEREFITLR